MVKYINTSWSMFQKQISRSELLYRQLLTMMTMIRFTLEQTLMDLMLANNG